MPFIYKHVAVMPDCHNGKGATVGTVLATNGAIIPAAVGVDIGCGMVAVKTPLKRDAFKEPAELCAGIERRVPMSVARSNNTTVATAARQSLPRRIGHLECLSHHLNRRRRTHSASPPT
jgi:tRNA-splicing ligase RtcB (3'-phosphate/5'-hydroxy nucleic acid ligase)